MRVLRADGRPAPGCRVSFFLDRGGYHDSERDATTGTDGRAVLRGLQRTFERIGPGLTGLLIDRGVDVPTQCRALALCRPGPARQPILHVIAVCARFSA